MASLHTTIADNIQKIRKKKGLTLQDLASLMNYEGGSTIYNKLSGSRHFSIDDLELAAKALDVPISTLIKEPDNTEGWLSMDVNRFYSYENLGLDPNTCVCITDNNILTIGNEHLEVDNDIEDLIRLFFNEAFVCVGPGQLYIARSLSGQTIVGVSACIIHKEAPQDEMMFWTNNDGCQEEEMVRAIIKALDFASFEVTGIFVEKENGVWSIVHDGVSDDADGIIVAPEPPEEN